jgi:catechol 2,3-dioxygenase-like lactoylglutathione lyase family enzyme
MERPSESSTVSPSWQPVPGMQGLAHVGLTVPDLEKAVSFFVGALGCSEIYRVPRVERDDDWMLRHLDVHPRAVLRGACMLRDPNGINLEIFEYEAPGQRQTGPRNSDIGGHHLSFSVADCEAAAQVLRSQGIRVLGEVKYKNDGQAWVYFLTPWNLQCELISDGTPATRVGVRPT